MPAIRLVRARRNAVAATRRPTVLAKRDQAGLRTTQPLRPTPLHNPRQNTADLILATETAARTPLSVIRRKIFTLSVVGRSPLIIGPLADQQRRIVGTLRIGFNHMVRARGKG